MPKEFKTVGGQATFGIMEFMVPFINAGGPPQLANDDGYTLVHAAADGWQYRMIDYLILSGADPNAQDKDGTTPLHLLTSTLDVPYDGQFISDDPPIKARNECISTLLLRGANARIKNNPHGATPLHYAAQNGDKAAVRLLARPGNIDELTIAGTSALTLAVIFDHVECASHLLAIGASVHVSLPDNSSLIDLIRTHDDPKMRRLAQDR